jgi:argininosuccinate lyase
VTLALVAMEGLMGTVTFDTERMQQAADGPSLVAVDLAEWLVARGVPFRDAHGPVAALVRESVERHVPIAELIEAHPAFGEEALTLLEPGSALRRHRSAGGTGPDAVALQMQRFVGRVEIDAARLSSWTR